MVCWQQLRQLVLLMLIGFISFKKAPGLFLGAFFMREPSPFFNSTQTTHS